MGEINLPEDDVLRRLLARRSRPYKPNDMRSKPMERAVEEPE
jgi:hypothetical protein